MWQLPNELRLFLFQSMRTPPRSSHPAGLELGTKPGSEHLIGYVPLASRNVSVHWRSLE